MSDLSLAECADAFHKDQRELRKLREELATMTTALRFYANRHHLAGGVWDSCSGEHVMWQFPDEDTVDEVMVEGGWIAKLALNGEELRFVIPETGALIDDDSDTESGHSKNRTQAV